MTHYLDIRIRPMSEISPTHVLEVLFRKIHLALVKLQSNNIGISFPEVDEKRHSLGLCLRLHGTEQDVHIFGKQVNLAGLYDYLSVGAIRSIPSKGISFRQVSRVQTKSNVERLRRRLAKRHNLSHEEAVGRIPDDAAKTTCLPFIRMCSNSSGQDFLLFIRHSSIQNTPMSGIFNAYGLSGSATVPWF